MMEILHALIGIGILIAFIVVIVNRCGERKEEKYEKRKWQVPIDSVQMWFRFDPAFTG